MMMRRFQIICEGCGNAGRVADREDHAVLVAWRFPPHIQSYYNKDGLLQDLCRHCQVKRAQVMAADIAANEARAKGKAP